MQSWDDVIAELRQYWTWETKNQLTHRGRPAKQYAQEYMKKAKLPLTELEALYYDMATKNYINE
jgi:hypothetical protein